MMDPQTAAIEANNRVVCPYDNAHRILPNKMPYHLMKCRKNFPDKEFVVCPYSACHEVHPVELRYHMIHCPAKVLLEKESVFGFEIAEMKRKGYTAVPKIINRTYDNIDSENWDDDDSFDYLQERIKNGAGIKHIKPSRRPFTQSKAERLVPVVQTERCSSRCEESSSEADRDNQVNLQSCEDRLSNLSVSSQNNSQTRPHPLANTRILGRGRGLALFAPSTRRQSSKPRGLQQNLPKCLSKGKKL